jgi:ATP-dependent exoDNAse (exonuclease V) beta subunit
LGLTWPGIQEEAVKLSQRVRQELLDEGYGKCLFAWASQLAPHCDRRDLSRLQQLVELAFAYQKRSTLRAADFVQLVAGQRVADPQPAQVRVMTIHQAKGLQFDVVVLPELDGKLVGTNDPFVVGRPGPAQPVSIVCRYADEAAREFLPAEFQQLFADNLQQKMGEALCVLYVALTRPVHALHMITKPGKPNEKNLPKTSAGLIRATLALGQPANGRTLLYEHGQTNWISKSAPQDLAEAKPAKGKTAPPAPSPIAFAAKSQLPKRLDRVAPSQLEGGKRLPLAELFKPESLGLHYGTLIHAWFEQIEWLEQGEPTDALLNKVAREELEDVAASLLDVPAAMKGFHSLLKQPALRDLLTLSGYRSKLVSEQPKRGKDLKSCEFVVQRERPFAYRDEGRLVNGFMDRLVLERLNGRYVGAQVLDYKTDDVTIAGKQAARTEYYRPQLQAYIAAIVRMFQLPAENVTARLIYVGGGKVTSELINAE